jgi:hypothetical protein
LAPEIDGTGGGDQAPEEADATGEANDACDPIEPPALGFVPTTLHAAMSIDVNRTTTARLCIEPFTLATAFRCVAE